MYHIHWLDSEFISVQFDYDEHIKLSFSENLANKKKEMLINQENYIHVLYRLYGLSACFWLVFSSWFHRVKDLEFLCCWTVLCKWTSVAFCMNQNDRGQPVVPLRSAGPSSNRGSDRCHYSTYQLPLGGQRVSEFHRTNGGCMCVCSRGIMSPEVSL